MIAEADELDTRLRSLQAERLRPVPELTPRDHLTEIIHVLACALRARRQPAPDD